MKEVPLALELLTVLNGDESLCTGCGLCAVVCPISCISIALDEEGFLRPRLVGDCVSCGACRKVCRRFAQPDTDTDLLERAIVYAAVAKDNDILGSTSSGGVAAVLAEELVKQGYKACGVEFSVEGQDCSHALACTTAEARRFRGSKYLQSNTVSAFARMTGPGRYVVFGCPCQIWALDRLLRNEGRRSKFLLVDLFCKGVPSRLLWTSYIAFISRIQKDFTLSKFNFRDKEVSWHRFSLTATGESGEVYSKTLYDDLFMQCFVKNVAFMEACYACTFRHHESAADMRLGDFWGSKYYSNDTGVSLVALFTDSGRRAWNQIAFQLRYEENPPSEVRESQRFDEVPRPPVREEFLRALLQGLPLEEAYKRFKIDEIKFKKGDTK